MNSQELKDKQELRQARNELVVKHNDLLRKSRYTLSSTEQKILIYLISKIKAEDTELKPINIDIKEFCQVANIQLNGEAYNRIKGKIKSIADKSWWLSSGENKEILFRWIDNAEIEKGNGIITLGLSKHLKPYLIALKRDFTRYELINVLTLKSKYSIRLYELLKSYLWRGHWEVEVNELRELLEVNNKYEEFKDFKKKVLIPTVKEINDYTDLQVEIETLKTGRTIKHINFKLEEKLGYQMVMPMLDNRKERLGDE